MVNPLHLSIGKFLEFTIDLQSKIDHSRPVRQAVSYIFLQNLDLVPQQVFKFIPFPDQVGFAIQEEHLSRL